MICSGNTSSDKCVPPLGTSFVDIDMNGYVSLSDLNILTSFITGRTSLLSNITIQTPGNINELSILMQFVNADMTRPSAATTTIYLELGRIGDDPWICDSIMAKTQSLNGFVFVAVFVGNGS